MKIENLEDLQNIIDLCTKKGVYQIKIDNLELHMNAYEQQENNNQMRLNEILSELEEDNSEEESVLYWSS